MLMWKDSSWGTKELPPNKLKSKTAQQNGNEFTQEGRGTERVWLDHFKMCSLEWSVGGGEDWSNLDVDTLLESGPSSCCSRRAEAVEWPKVQLRLSRKQSTSAMLTVDSNILVADGRF